MLNENFWDFSSSTVASGINVKVTFPDTFAPRSPQAVPMAAPSAAPAAVVPQSASAVAAVLARWAAAGPGATALDGTERGLLAATELPGGALGPRQAGRADGGAARQGPLADPTTSQDEAFAPTLVSSQLPALDPRSGSDRLVPLQRYNRERA